ncbi:MAG: GNAT family N-acetyltransferase [Thermoplasmata archaeon]|nr:GNAT family N-acetyltransferase [Thermoplasmata archaeon]
MSRSLHLLKEPENLRRKLETDIIQNSGFLWRVYHQNEAYKIYATDDLECAMALQEGEKHTIFTGDWNDVEIPGEILPEDGTFVSSSPASAIERLRGHYKLEGEWPCWHFLAPSSFGPGEWDELEPLRDSDVPYVASFWELGGDDREEHIRDSVKKFESACVRVDGKPLSWCGLHFEMPGVGNLGFAHTLEEHRRKGYAQLTTKALVNRLAAKGGRATAEVIKDNKISIAVCKSMGFEVIGEVSWADFKKLE